LEVELEQPMTNLNKGEPNWQTLGQLAQQKNQS